MITCSRRYTKDVNKLPIKSSNRSLMHLSNLLYKNCFQKYHELAEDQDDSLTSLSWLNNIDISLNGNHWKKHEHCTLFPEKLQQALHEEGLFDETIRREYRTSWSSKPPFSYTTLICMAMLEMGRDKIALFEIYEWIRRNFLFYRVSDSSWQNSVRHNLSLKKCFEKVPRTKGERGKGGFWRLNASYSDNLGSNLVKYRRQFQTYTPPPIQKGYFKESSTSKLVNRFSSAAAFNKETNSRIRESFVNINNNKESQNSMGYNKLNDNYNNDNNNSNNDNINNNKNNNNNNNINNINNKWKFNRKSSICFRQKPTPLPNLLWKNNSSEYVTVRDTNKVTTQIRQNDKIDKTMAQLNSTSTIDSMSLDNVEYPLLESSSANSDFSLTDFETSTSSFDSEINTNSTFQLSPSDENYDLSFPLDLDHILSDL